MIAARRFRRIPSGTGGPSGTRVAGDSAAPPEVVSMRRLAFVFGFVLAAGVCPAIEVNATDPAAGVLSCCQLMRLSRPAHSFSRSTYF